MSHDLDALPLEYKLYQRGTLRNENIPNGLHNPVPKGKVSVLCRGLPEESCDLTAFQRGLVSNYPTNPLLVGKDAL